MSNLAKLLRAVVEHKASDMHITPGNPPTLRVNGKIVKLKLPSLSAEQTRELCFSVLTDSQKTVFEQNKEIDFSFNYQNLTRFRGHLFYQRGSVSGNFRLVPFDVPKLETLGLPASLSTLINKSKGLFIITGPAGCGKSTTVASLINEFNNHRQLHIVTIEDPIEYTYRHKKCIINQREVGYDTKSFATALKSAMREDPDVVLIGEMRDQETIETALRLAETGQLVLTTMHTSGAHQTISRILNSFSAEKQVIVRTQLALLLEGILTQVRLRKTDGSQVVACELLIPSSSIRSLIRENKLHQIPTSMQTGQESSGMITLNQSLKDLVSQEIVKFEDAIEASPDPDELCQLLSMGQKKLKTG